MNIADLKNNQSIKLNYQFNKTIEVESVGVVLSVLENKIEIISDVNNRGRGNRYTDYLISIDKDKINTITRTRFPKEVSNELKNIAESIRKIRDVESKIRKLEDINYNYRSDIKKIEDKLVTAKFETNPSLSDLATKLKKDIKGLNKYSYCKATDVRRELILSDVNSDSSEKKVYLSLSFNKITRNIKGVRLDYNHMGNLDNNDWDYVSKTYIQSFEKEVKEAFSFASKITFSLNSEPGEKQYVYLSNDFIIHLNLNKDNYDEVLKKNKKAVNSVSHLYLDA